MGPRPKLLAESSQKVDLWPLIQTQNTISSEEQSAIAVILAAITTSSSDSAFLSTAQFSSPVQISLYSADHSSHRSSIS